MNPSKDFYKVDSNQILWKEGFDQLYVVFCAFWMKTIGWKMKSYHFLSRLAINFKNVEYKINETKKIENASLCK